MIDLQEYLRGWKTGDFPPPPIASLIGFELQNVSKGRCWVNLAVDRKHHNPMGIVHGGIYCDLADAAMGIALASLMEEGETFSTTTLSIQYFAPVREGNLVAEACVTMRGRSIAHVECDIQEEGGIHIAKAWSTCLISQN